jgi:hypothetical protein
MAKTKRTAPPEAAPEVTVLAFKGFDPDLKCRGFQFEVGKAYEHTGPVSACYGGFHACENPFDVLDHYGLLDDAAKFNRFARVSLSGSLSRDGTTKIAAGRIAIDAELHPPDFLAHAIKWVIDTTTLAVPVLLVKSSVPAALTDNGRDSAQIGSSGDSAQIGSSGDSAKIGSSGDYAKIGSSGHSAKIGSSGHSAKIGSSGHSAQIGSSGDSAKIGSSGDYAQIGSSGHSAQIGSSGDSAKIGSSGHSAKIGSSGDYAKIGSSGHSAKIEATGARAVVASAGFNCTAKAGKDGAICLTWHDGKRARFVVGYVGEDGIEAGVAYRAEAGKLVEVA